MSWNVWLETSPCPTCGHKPDRGDFNHTSNLAGALVEIWGPDFYWGDLSGKSAAEALPHIERAVGALTFDPKHFKKYEPDNGWGSVESLNRFLRAIAQAMRENPAAIVRVST